MRRFLLIFLAQGLVYTQLWCAQSAPLGVPRIGVLDFYGLRKVSSQRILKVLGVREGDPLPGSKAELEERLEKIPGVVRSRLEAVCCDGGNAILFVGIEEKGAPHFNFRSPPAGAVRLPGEIVETYRKFLEALEIAVRNGKGADDLRSGHSLMADPDARAPQERFAIFAELQLSTLRDVLRNSADEEQRAMAAYVIGYARRKRDVVDDLQYAIQDPAGEVRNNAMRALAAISVLAGREPDLGIQISPTWFVEMLNSLVWTDRNKAVMALVNLTDQRPERTMNLIRERALLSLVEMARFHSLSHAIGPFMLVGRLAGLSDAQIEEKWTKGERESVIAKVLKSPRKPN